jgi:hypothetical protein
MTTVCTRFAVFEIGSLQKSFLAVVPQIRAYARRVFRHRSLQDRRELVAETIAWAWKLFRAYVRRGKDPIEKLISVLRYSALAVKSGRRLGRSMRSNELFEVCRRADCSTQLIRLVDCPWQDRTPLREMLIDRKAFSPADAAASRIDIEAWLRTLSGRNRRIAKVLAKGERPSAASRMFQVSAARIAQLRREFRRSWEQFQSMDATASIGDCRLTAVAAN